MCFLIFLPARDVSIWLVIRLTIGNFSIFLGLCKLCEHLRKNRCRVPGEQVAVREAGDIPAVVLGDVSADSALPRSRPAV